MVRVVTDEDFNGHIIRGLLRAVPILDLVRVQDVDLLGASDPDVLEFAANDERV